MTANKDNNPSWHILDPALGYPEAIGHHISYNAALAECLRQRGQSYCFYGHRNGQPVAGIEKDRIIGAFKYCHLEWMSRFGRKGIRLRIFAYLFDLLRLPRPGALATPIFFFHTVSIDQLVAILLWRALQRPMPGTRVVVVMRYEVPNPDDSSLRFVKWLLRILKFTGIYFASDSASLARNYEREFGREVAVLPIPHAPHPKTRFANRPITIGYLGTSFHERGYHMLPDLIVGILRKAPDVRLIIQSQPLQRRQREYDAFERLCFLEEEFGFRHIRGTVDGAKLANLFNELDMILLPYNPQVYRNRTAGIFSDAVSANVVPMPTKGTWMADQLTSIPESFRLVPEFSSRAFIDSTMRFLADPDSFRGTYSEFAANWRSRNTVEALLDRIAAI